MNPNILYSSSMEDDVIFDQAHFELLHSETSNGPASGSSTNPQTPEVASRRSKSRKLGKLLRTAALCASYFGLGLCMAITGPTLPNLQAQVEASVSQISYIFTARSIGTLTGSFAGGILFDRYNRYSLLFMVVVCMAIGVGSTPWCRRLWLLMCSSVFIGIGGGFLDTGASVLCLELWGIDAGPYMQALHFFFGLGGFVAPLLAQPFLGGGSPNTDVAFNSTGRHVRSTPEYAASALNFSNHSDPVNFTLPALVNLTALDNITTAATTPPPLSTLTTLTPANIPTPAVNASLNGTSVVTVPPPAGNTTLASPVDSNATEATTKGPTPKPKPQFINGSVLGNSEQWEKTPLQQVPAADKNPPPTTLAPTTTTPAAPDSANATAGPNVTVSSAVAAANSSLNDSVTESANATTAASVPILSNITAEPPAVNSTSAPYPNNSSDIAGEPVSSKSTPSLNHSTLLIHTSTPSDPVSDKIETPSTPNTIAAATTTTTAATITASSVTENSRTTIPVNLVSPKVEGVDSVPLEGSEEKLPVPAQPDAAETTTTADVTSTAGTVPPKDEEEDSATTTGGLVTKSRGKSRGQQEEHADATTTTTAKTAVTQPSPPTRHKPVTYTNGSEDDFKPGAKIDVDWEKYGVTRIHLLYSIIAVIVLHIAFSFLFFLCPSERERMTAAAAARTAAGSKPRRKNLFVTLLCLVYLIYVGMEVSYSQFLTTFGMRSDLQLPEESANYVTAILWGSFALTRLAAVFFASFLNPTYMLTGNFLLCFVGSLTLCIWGQSSQLILSVGSAMMGIGMASTFATGFVWTEKRLAVTNRIASAFSICSALGEMISPAITGALLEHEAMSLMYYSFASCCACIICLGGAWFLSRKRRGLLGSDVFLENEYQLAKQVEDEHELN